MDSPVIVDAASKLGREIDLDHCSFPGFPFDDDADVFERPRSDGIRAHLDDLAARHPEFAEHLRGPPWPFSGSLLRDRRRRRRGSGSSNNDDQQQPNQQHQDEDARSQASGSSAASGASAVSSHSGGGGEHDSTSSSAIPQYGLRNTVDIGQQQRRRDMETSPEKDERGQRSMSAPPTESWQQPQSQQPGQEQQLPPQPGQGQRFVSRVDITPQHNQQRAQSPSKPASNVRHIPIFVEGRDVPVMPKVATDDAPPSTFQQRQSSPPSHFDRSSPPAHHFHRPSHFNERFSRQQWPPSHFQDAFYKPAGFEQPMRRQFQSQHQQPQYYYQQPQHQQQPQYQHPPYQQQQQQQPQHHYEQHHQQQQTQQSQPQPHQEQQQQQQETPKPKPPVPKDPLERVAQVQKEVDNLAEQVQRYVGGSRQDKEYMYLDEMLTRELIKLDDIETEGRENVRQARKNAIKSIQDTISLLETKTPIAKQQEQQPTAHKVAQECSEKDQQGEEISHVPEPMEVDAKQEKLSSEPIPLPPVPSSPTKTKVESSESESAATAVESANQNVIPTGQQITEQKTENPVIAEQPVASTDESTKCAVETSKESKPSDGKDEEQQKDLLRTMENKHATSKQQTKETTEGKTEVNDGQRSSTESPRLQKKAKKTKKKEQQQQPVSEQAIPLPPPPTESTK
ncbi:PREDICTED: BAG domain-containing protein Samui-like isoform X2 [Trachymyrmex cornetzi]|uniref:BAG domain-containing protein Samui-like isoform X2 n=1 Tax=Trachymyrmex cornetzi TaxID=471704 RepID=UPI00084F66BE|nr:PREDICTED: BAG domain-containing protein Samui-like isoform X2 [Trachymyrmex cornetzi]